MTRGRTGRFTAALATIALAVGACAKDPPKEQSNIFPADYKAQILKRLRMHLEDPTNLRDAYLAEPVLRNYQATTRYIACLRYNAKEQGQYAGGKEMAAFFYEGQITQIVPAGELCANAAYLPFPEAQKM